MLNSPSNTSKFRRVHVQSGWTLMEMMIALGVGALILGAILMTSVYVAKSFVIIGNYHDLNKESRHTLDLLTRDIRSISNVTFFANNEIKLVDIAGNQIEYKWDGSSNLTRTFNGTSEIMLQDCDYFSMSNYQRNATANFSFYPADSTEDTKLIDVRWHCWRPVLGSHLTTESVQTAKIVARNF